MTDNLQNTKRLASDKLFVWTAPYRVNDLYPVAGKVLLSNFNYRKEWSERLSRILRIAEVKRAQIHLLFLFTDVQQRFAPVK